MTISVTPAGTGPLTERPAWKALEAHHRNIRTVHLRELFARDPGRGERMTAEAAGLYLDYSKNRIADDTLPLLVSLAEESGLRARIDAMFRGEPINVSEKRAVLHVALRAPRGASLQVDGRSVVLDVHAVLDRMTSFANRLRGGEFTAGAPIAQFVLLLQEAHRQGRDVPVNLPADAPVPHAIIEHAPDGTRRDIKAVAERMGLHLFYAPAMRNGAIAPEDRGTAILSTLPLSDLQAIELPFERQRRVALAATIEGTTPSGAAWRLRLADVQIDTSLALTRGGPFAARKRQAEALVEALTMGGPDATLPTVVGGDFNTWLGPQEPALDVMRRAFAEAPDASSHAPLMTASTWRGPLGMRAALDYVFLRGVPRTEAPHRL